MILGTFIGCVSRSYPACVAQSAGDRAVEGLPPSVVESLVLRGHLRGGDTRMRAVPMAEAADAGVGPASSDAERQVPLVNPDHT